MTDPWLEPIAQTERPGSMPSERSSSIGEAKTAAPATTEPGPRFAGAGPSKSAELSAKASNPSPAAFNCSRTARSCAENSFRALRTSAAARASVASREGSGGPEVGRFAKSVMGQRRGEEEGSRVRVACHPCLADCVGSDELDASAACSLAPHAGRPRSGWRTTVTTGRCSSDAWAGDMNGGDAVSRHHADGFVSV